MEATREVRLSRGTLRVRDTGAVSGGPTLVFVHGLLTDGGLWDRVVAQAAPWGRCVVPDLPLGSHRLPMDRRADLSPPAVADLIAELLEAMGLEEVTVVGNDTGGALAQMLVTRRPERIGRVVLTPCDAFDNFLPPMFAPMTWIARVPGAFAVLLQPARIRALHNTPLAYGTLTRRPIPTELTARWVQPALKQRGVRRDLAKFLRGVSSKQTLDAAERLPRFDRPALVVWNEYDRIFPREHGERLAALLPQGRLETVADTGVYVPLDQPARLAELLERFCRQPAGAAA